MAHAIVANFNKLKARQLLIVALVFAGVLSYVLFGARMVLSRVAVAPTTPIVRAPGAVTSVGVGWATGGLMDDLKAEGFNPAPVSGIKRDFFGASGKIITLSGDNVQAFEYSNAAAASSDAVAFKESASTPGGAWKKKIHLYEKGSLLLLYTGQQKNILEALSKIMGPPAPLK